MIAEIILRIQNKNKQMINDRIFIDNFYCKYTLLNFISIKLIIENEILNDDHCGRHGDVDDYRDYYVGQLPQVDNIFLYILTYPLDYALLHT